MHAVTTFKAKGDPGYYLSCSTRFLFSSVLLTDSLVVMLAECGLALLKPENLPKMAQKGGILTTATAFGDVLVTRLNNTKKFQIASELVTAKDGPRVY